MLVYLWDRSKPEKMVVILLGDYREAFIFLIIWYCLIFMQNVYISFGIQKKNTSMDHLVGTEGLDWKHI